MKKTVLYNAHIDLGARMVEFAGWKMPLHYGSQIKEHHIVRRFCGVFDVSHMLICDLADDEQTRIFLSTIFSGDVGQLVPGKAKYGCLLNEKGGVVDDLIVYKLDGAYRLISNAGTSDKVLHWYAENMPDTGRINQREDLSLLAIQGPESRKLLQEIFPQYQEQILGLKPFSAFAENDWFISCSGYTGEDGFELAMPESECLHIWKCLQDKQIAPIGLGARDSLRLEAGMPLYGHELGDEITPLEARLGWVVDFIPEGRKFIGRESLEQQKKAEMVYTQIGVLLEQRGVLRDGMRLFKDNKDIGFITSGGFSPSLNCAIGLARVSESGGKDITVEIRGKQVPVQLVKTPFVRQGHSCIEGLQVTQEK